MSDLRPDQGGPPPENGGARGGLPDLPPEWGTVIIPDDAAELDAEAVEVRRELRRAALRTRAQTLAARFPGGRRDSLAVPLIIMAVALTTTLLSLFVVTWDHRRGATAPAGPDNAVLQASIPLADVQLADAAGTPVTLRSVLPAVLLLVGDCGDCTSLISAVAEQTPKPVTVVAVGPQAPCAVGAGKNLICLADPDGAITGRYPTVAAVRQSLAPSTTPPDAQVTEFAAPTEPEPAEPAALAVPVDAEGAAREPVLVEAADDVAEAVVGLV